MAIQARSIRYDFRGENAFATATNGAGCPFVKALDGSASVDGLEGGGVRLALDATDEAQNACLYMGDVLPFDIDEIISFEVIARTVASVNAATQIAFGLVSARNDAIDSITEAALFRCVGSNNVVIETDDGTNNNDDVATGFTLGVKFKRFGINFADRVTTMEPPTFALGRPSNLGFYAANDLGSKRRVASGRRLDMSSYSGGLQVFAQIQKTGGTQTDSLDILEACVEVNLPA